MLYRDFFVDERQRVGIDHGDLWIEHLEARSFGQKRRQGIGSDKAQIDQHFAEHLAGNLFLLKGDIQLRRRDNAHGNKTVADPALGRVVIPQNRFLEAMPVHDGNFAAMRVGEFTFLVAAAPAGR